MTATAPWFLVVLPLACLVGQAHARSDAKAALADPIDTSLGDRQETVTVWGHRPRFSAAPKPDPGPRDPGHAATFDPGSRLGIVRIEGGPVHDAVSDGVSAGVAIPISGIRGLAFTASLAGTRDALSPSGTTGAAAVVAGFRLKF